MFQSRLAHSPRRLLLLSVILLGCSSAAALGQTGPAAAVSLEQACANKASNVEITACAADFAAKVDRDLNAIWQRVLSSIDGATHLTKAQRSDWRAKLTAAQRHWVAFKTADCREPVGYEWFGGSGMSSAVSSCLAKHTQDRMQDLKARYLDR
jgi:uncharacterized protein YecT (DUF1311 family)